MPTPLLDAARRADLFFMNQSPIHDAMRRLHRTLASMDIPFAVAGAMAANAHGHRRTTADVDILIRGDDLRRFKETHLGRSYVSKFEGSKKFRDAVTGVAIDALITGGFPGDGKPKPVAFPDPADCTELHDDGLPYVTLPTLLNLKIACGMSTIHRPRDFDDVIQLIRVRQLSEHYAGQLNPMVRETFGELWQAAQIDEEF